MTDKNLKTCQCCGNNYQVGVEHSDDEMNHCFICSENCNICNPVTEDKEFDFINDKYPVGIVQHSHED